MVEPWARLIGPSARRSAARGWALGGSGGRGGSVLLDRNCKHLDIDLFAYLQDILRRLLAHPADQLDELLPDVWFASHPSARRKAAA